MDSSVPETNELSLTYLLDVVRNIDYNFSVKETPFSVKISIKKTKIKYQENTEHFETYLTEKVVNPIKWIRLKP